jgi:hypothetical protein
VRHYKTIILTVLLLTVTAFSASIYSVEQKRRVIKEDLVELSMVKYGLFNVDEWKRILAGIISKKVEELNLEGANREEMRKKISELLYKVIGDFEQRFYKENSRSLKGFLRSAITYSVGGFDRVKKDIPKFTEQILDFLNDPKNRKALKGYIIEKLNTYADNTFSKVDYFAHDEILARHDFTDRPAAIDGLGSAISEIDKRSRPFKVAILLIGLVSIAWVFFAKRFSRVDFMLLIAISLSLLVTGLLLPMIEIDARISSMQFTLLGETVSFADQVLYYKSKSILEVVWLMLSQSRYDVLIVGVLVFVFSVLFPLAKQIASVFFVNMPSVRENPFVRFLVFKTGKWSMADVMVIAIFMSYIGFSGIITEQLRQIESMTSSLEILTTNRSSLLIGFFFFTSFAIFSISISQKIELQYKK